jgi:hypothetical protein
VTLAFWNESQRVRGDIRRAMITTSTWWREFASEPWTEEQLNKP